MPGQTAAERRQIVEANMTPADFLRELVDRKAVKLPEKRYRVEDSEAHNSCLLDLDAAKITRQRYGGTIKELVSTTTFYAATAKFLENACEECSAARGKPCTDGLGNIRAPHDVRVGKTTRSDRLALKLPECPTCKVKAGRPCRTDAGRKQMPHRLRLPPKEKKPRVKVKDLGACEKCGANAGQACRTTNPHFPGSAYPNAKVPRVKTHAGRPRASEAA